MAPRYKLSELSPPRNAHAVKAYALDDHGNAVGEAYVRGLTVSTKAVVWIHGSPTTLTISNEQMSFSAGVNEINDTVYAVGALPAEDPPHAFLSRGTQVEDLHPLFGTHSSWATGVNNSGAVVGCAGANAFVYDSQGGGVTFIDPLPDHPGTLGHAINDSGHVTGISSNWRNQDTRVFLCANGQVTDQGLATHASGINNSDTIVGAKSFDGAPEYTAYRLRPGTGFENLGHTSTPGYSGSYGRGINDQGVVVGESFAGWWEQQGQPPVRPFVHFPQGTPDAGWWDLEDVTSNADGWVFEWATDINNAGEILGVGMYQRMDRAFVLKPQRRFDLVDYALRFVTLFGGVEAGGGGVGILPGGRPVPIDPDGWRALSPAERDLQVVLAVRRVAQLLEDRQSQELLDQTAIEIVETAIKRLERGT
jgi:hypothetical protein